MLNKILKRAVLAMAAIGFFGYAVESSAHWGCSVEYRYPRYFAPNYFNCYEQAPCKIVTINLVQDMVVVTNHSSIFGIPFQETRFMSRREYEREQTREFVGVCIAAITSIILNLSK